MYHCGFSLRKIISELARSGDTPRAICQFGAGCLVAIPSWTLNSVQGEEGRGIGIENCLFKNIPGPLERPLVFSRHGLHTIHWGWSGLSDKLCVLTSDVSSRGGIMTQR